MAGAGETFATGDPMNVAARLEAAAEADEILLGSQTFALVAAAVRAEAVEPLEPKGKAERVPAYRLIEVFPHAPAYTRRLDAPFVGRGRELGTLLGELARAEEAPPRRPRTQPSRRRRSPRPTTTTPTPLRSPSEHRFMLAEARAGRLGREAVATVPVKGGRLSALTLLALAVAAEAAGNRDEAVVAAKEAAEIVRLLGYAALEPRLRLSGVA